MASSSHFSAAEFPELTFYPDNVRVLSEQKEFYPIPILDRMLAILNGVITSRRVTSIDRMGLKKIIEKVEEIAELLKLELNHLAKAKLSILIDELELRCGHHFSMLTKATIYVVGTFLSCCAALEFLSYFIWKEDIFVQNFHRKDYLLRRLSYIDDALRFSVEKNFLVMCWAATKKENIKFLEKYCASKGEAFNVDQPPSKLRIELEKSTLDLETINKMRGQYVLLIKSSIVTTDYLLKKLKIFQAFDLSDPRVLNAWHGDGFLLTKEFLRINIEKINQLRSFSSSSSSSSSSSIFTTRVLSTSSSFTLPMFGDENGRPISHFYPIFLKPSLDDIFLQINKVLESVRAMSLTVADLEKISEEISSITQAIGKKQYIAAILFLKSLIEKERAVNNFRETDSLEINIFKYVCYRAAYEWALLAVHDNRKGFIIGFIETINFLRERSSHLKKDTIALFIQSYLDERTRFFLEFYRSEPVSLFHYHANMIRYLITTDKNPEVYKQIGLHHQEMAQLTKNFSFRERITEEKDNIRQFRNIQIKACEIQQAARTRQYLFLWGLMMTSLVFFLPIVNPIIYLVISSAILGTGVYQSFFAPVDLTKENFCFVLEKDPHSFALRPSFEFDYNAVLEVDELQQLFMKAATVEEETNMPATKSKSPIVSSSSASSPVTESKSQTASSSSVSSPTRESKSPTASSSSVSSPATESKPPTTSSSSVSSPVTISDVKKDSRLAELNELHERYKTELGKMSSAAADSKTEEPFEAKLSRLRQDALEGKNDRKFQQDCEKFNVDITKAISALRIQQEKERRIIERAKKMEARQAKQAAAALVAAREHAASAELVKLQEANRLLEKWKEKDKEAKGRIGTYVSLDIPDVPTLPEKDFESALRALPADRKEDVLQSLVNEMKAAILSLQEKIDEMNERIENHIATTRRAPRAVGFSSSSSSSHSHSHKFWISGEAAATAATATAATAATATTAAIRPVAEERKAMPVSDPHRIAVPLRPAATTAEPATAAVMAIEPPPTSRRINLFEFKDSFRMNLRTLQQIYRDHKLAEHKNLSDTTQFALKAAILELMKLTCVNLLSTKAFKNHIELTNIRHMIKKHGVFFAEPASVFSSVVPFCAWINGLTPENTAKLSCPMRDELSPYHEEHNGLIKDNTTRPKQVNWIIEQLIRQIENIKNASMSDSTKTAATRGVLEACGEFWRKKDESPVGLFLRECKDLNNKTGHAQIDEVISSTIKNCSSLGKSLSFKNITQQPKGKPGNLLVLIAAKIDAWNSRKPDRELAMAV